MPPVALTVTLTSLTYLPVPVVVVETSRQGGGGGGVVKIVSTGTLTIGANIWADGGRGGARWNEARRSGGSGSGGAIYLKGDNVIINAGVKISASGGLPALENRELLPVVIPMLPMAEERVLPVVVVEECIWKPPLPWSIMVAPPTETFWLPEEPVPVVRERMVRSRLSDHRLPAWSLPQEV